MSDTEIKPKKKRTKKASPAKVMLPVIRVTNPFNPREFVREELVWERKKTLADYFPDVVVSTVGHEVVSVNGKIVPKEQFAVTYLDRTDNLVVCPVPHGGGGKNILGVVALIAIAVFAPYAVNFLAGAGWTGAAAGTFAATGLGAAATIGVTVAGAAIVSAMMAPSTPSMGGGSSSSSPTYGIDGAKNTSMEGVPVPICYGKFRMAGNFLNIRVDNTDDDRQTLYMLINAGEGPVEAITDIELNGIPIEKYNDKEVAIRLGGSDNSVMIPWFNDLIQPYNVGKQVTTDWQYYTTTGEVDRLRLDITAPQGLFYVDRKKGDDHAVTVDVLAEYRKVGTTAWKTYPGTSQIIAQHRVYYVTEYIPEAGKSYSYVNINRNSDDRKRSSPRYRPMYKTLKRRRIGSEGEHRHIYRELNHVTHWYYDANNAKITDPDDLAYLARTYGNPKATLSKNETKSLFVTGPRSWDKQRGGYELKGCLLPQYGSTLRLSTMKKSAVRKSFMSSPLSEGKYEIRFRRNTANSTDSTRSDDVYLSDVNEIITDNICYHHTALVGIKIRLSDQLTGIPKVTFVNHGKMIDVYSEDDDPALGGIWKRMGDDNPAWIVWDILTDRLHGAGLSEDRLDLHAFKRWASYCDDNLLFFEGVFDNELNIWDALQQVMRVGHAQLVGIGTRFTVVIEKTDDPVMMFSVANIIDGTFKETWTGVADRANEIEVTYFDRNDAYKQKTVRAVDEQAQAAGDTQRTASVTLFGCTDGKRAYKEAVMQLNMNRYIRQTVEFGAPIEAVACTVGDLIYVQHDMPQWGFGGRTEAGSTTSVIQLDRPMTMDSGKQHKLLLVMDAVQRASGSVVSVVGTTLIVNGWNGVGRVKRIQVAGKDLQILSTFDNGNGEWGIVVNSAAGIAVGNTHSLWDTDVIEERDVVNELGEVTQVTVQSPFSAAPDAFVNYMFGEVDKIKKPFRVKAINGNHDYRRDITAIEYNASVYDLDGVVIPTPNYSSLDMSVQHVQINSTEEGLSAFGGTFKSKVTVHFSGKGEQYANAIVYASINDGAWEKIADTATDRASIIADDADLVRFKVQARDVLGSLAPNDDQTPTVEHRVVGKLAPPSDVQGFEVQVRASDLVLVWSPVTDIDLAGYEIRIGTSWDTGSILTTGFNGTMLTHDQEQAGTYLYHIRAIDTGGRYSANVSSFTLVLPSPSPVSGFDCVQNGDRIEFRWRTNVEPNIIGYELREGTTWSSAKLVTTVSATTYSMPANSIPGERTFWIKSIAAPGIYTDTAVFSTTKIAVSEDRNVVYEDNEYTEGFIGSKFNVEVLDGALILKEGENYGEYTWGVNLPAVFRARNSIDSAMEAVLLGGTSWAMATYAWNSTNAERRWLAVGDLSTVDLDYFISRHVGIPAEQIEGFSLNATVLGERGTAAAESVGVNYEAGRFLKGVQMSDFTRLNWNVALPAQFNTTFWMIPTAAPSGNHIIWVAERSNGVQLICGYHNGAFYLENTANTVRVSVPMVVEVQDRILIGIVQTATDRKLMVGKLGGASASSTVAAAPLGDFAKVKLHQ